MQSQPAVIAKRADPNHAELNHADPNHADSSHADPNHAGPNHADSEGTTAGGPDTTEIRKLAAAAGYEVVAAVTQTRAEDPATQFGSGKAAELAEAVADTGASVVIFDNELTPTQTVELADLCPEGTTVLDRYRLVLDVFEDRAGSERATLQVERARLENDLPRIREAVSREIAGENLAHDERGGGRVRDVQRRIDELDRKLDDLGDEAAKRRERRREEGFAFVALAGYTNAGKSTLLHRLADDLDFEAHRPNHDDLDETAEIEDRLFETLDTTTRRATVNGRRTLVTDTVGFVANLSHDLVSSFHGTLSETATADCVVLVADASDPPAELRRKLETSLDVAVDAGSGSADSKEGTDTDREIVPVLNKADLLDADELAERERVVAELAADFPESGETITAEPVPISATRGDGLDALVERMADALPDLREVELRLPNDDGAMSLVSWLYDHARVADVDYADTEVRVAFEARPSVVEKARAKADAVGGRARAAVSSE
ncbi:GTPase HflX [Halorussus litoreus]|uniref:GTPase HflX n=1 Tax=Halorussus litoreus TaxID=1710536 RepID=UPI000E278A4D|nr:GTPase HflX [Halorussus litoreus]